MRHARCNKTIETAGEKHSLQEGHANDTGAVTRHEFLESFGFLDFKELCERVPLSPRTLREAIKRKQIPHIRLPGARRLLFDWETVRASLRRFEEGGVQ